MVTTAMPGTEGPLPVTIIGGYLGAGKTTLVNAILSGNHGLRIAVLVNDFGKVPVDEALIVARGADVIALANGCMCCQIGGDLYDAIDRVLRMRDRFDHLLIETSGVADPAKVAQIAVAEPDLELSHTVVLVDAVNFADVLGDPRLNDTLLRQMRAADMLLLTKSGGADATTLAGLQRILAENGIDAPTAVLEKDTPEAWHLIHGQSGQGEARPSRAGPLTFHSVPFDSWSWQGDGTVARADLMAFAGDPALHIYRLKGRLSLTEGTAVLVHKVGSEITVEETAGDFGPSDLVAIGAKPHFEPSRVEAAWARLIRQTVGTVGW